MSRPLTIEPVSALRSMRPYIASTPVIESTLRLDANEGPPPDAGLLGELRKLTPEDLRRYASPARLESEIAQRWGIDAARIVVTSGGDDAIERTIRSVIEPGREAVIHSPTFVMIERGIRLAGGTVRSVPWLEGALPLDSMLDAINAKTGLVALVTPNNPTGGVIETEAIRIVARRAAEMGALLLLDLAYAEFAEDDPAARLLDEPNVVMIRTFSKAFGFAGIRVGYAIAPGDIAGWLRTVGGPYPVSTPSLALASAAFARGPRSEALDRTRLNREELTAILRQLGCSPLPSQGNFILCRLSSASDVRARLSEEGVGVREFVGDPILANCLRITVPDESNDLRRLEAALRAAVGSSSQGVSS